MSADARISVYLNPIFQQSVISVEPIYGNSIIQQYNVSWPSVPAAAYYNIYANPSPIFRVNQINTTPITGTNFVLIPTKSSVDITDNIWVQAVYPNGTSAFLNEFGATAYDRVDRFETNPLNPQGFPLTLDIDNSYMIYIRDEIRRRAKTILENDGEPFTIYQRRWRGIPCKVSQQLNNSLVNGSDPDNFADPDYQDVGLDEVCCLPDTVILLEKGEKKIQDIKVGDVVLTHQGNYCKVKRVFTRDVNENVFVIHSTLFQSSPLMVTGNHPILTTLKGTDQWVSAKDISIGDRLHSPKAEAVSVHEIGSFKYDGPVHNLEVETDNSYIANGIAVHNCFGTGIVGGYLPGMEVYLRYGNMPDRLLTLKKQAIDLEHDFDSWTLWLPKLHEQDLIVRHSDGQRFIVEAIGQSEWRGVPLHQKMKLKSLQDGDIRSLVTTSSIESAEAAGAAFGTDMGI